MLEIIRSDLKQRADDRLVDELLAAYVETKKSYYTGGLRLSEVEGGRFCEAAFRILEELTTGNFTALGTQLNADALIRQLGNLSRGNVSDSIRLHIPRALRVIYDIRNNRDAAHLGDGIDPNMQDATLVCSIIDWVLAEFVRLYHVVSADDAQKIIEDLVEKKVPAVEEFGDFLKILNPKLVVSDRVLVLLYQRGKNGALFSQLRSWVHPRMRTNLKRSLNKLEHDKAFIHCDDVRYYISLAGVKEVESRQLFKPPN